MKAILLASNNYYHLERADVDANNYWETTQSTRNDVFTGGLVLDGCGI